MSTSRQEIWDEIIRRGLQVTPEYGHEKVLADRFLMLEMDRAMTPTWWERLTLWFGRWV
jgi:hypothetical protein